MANVRKRILQLTALESASLDTTIVGVDNGTTYRIELDVLADAVTSRVNILDRDRLNSLESVTSSFETKGRSVISSSAQITAFGFISTSVTIPAGTISSSAQITSFGFVSSSADISSLNSFTSSQNTLNTAFTNGINTRLQTSTFNQYTASISTASLVDRLNAIENVSSSWITESETGSFLTSLNGAISSSAQLTSSYDNRYVLSGSITQTTWDNIASKPAGIISSSAQITSFGFVSGSYLTSLNGAISSSSQLTGSFDERYTLSGSVQNIQLPSNLVSSSAQITAYGFISSSQTIDTGSFLTTSSYQTDSASFDTRINSIITESGSNLTYFIEAYANVTYTLPGTFTEDICRYSVVSVNENVPSNWFNTSTHTFTPQKAGYWEIIASYDVYRNAEASLIIKKNNNIVASAGSFNAVAQDISKIVYLNGSTDYINIYNVGGATQQRDQYQSRSWFQAKFVGNISGSTELPSGLVSGSSQLTSSFDTRYEGVGRGIVSGSSQLTSSFDTRYTLSGSVVSGTTPAGTISGSSQLTSSFDGRYVQTGSFNTLTASFNSFTASAQSVTTGSNSFNGTQTITGSLIITTGSFVGSQILANTSSLYLTSGSNMYVQNNGLVEITGSLKVNGTTRFETVGGDEGGEIEFGVPQTNTTLVGSVKVDVYGNTFRIFDGNSKGVYIDLSKAPTGANGELMWKASGFVNAGDYVTLGNLKARIPTSGMRSLQLATVSGTYSVVGSNLYTANNAAGTSLTSPLSITTTPTYLNAGLNFTAVGWLDTWIIMDYVAFIAWRITMVIGPSFNANLITIERLY